MRVIDKLERQGKDAVLKELGPGRTDKSGDKIPGLNLKKNHIEKIQQFLDLAIEHRTQPLDAARDLLGSIEISDAGIAELQEIESHLNAMGVNPDHVEVDLTIVRGLGYYTGPVFETTLLDLPEYGSVFAGGRYDNLVDRFLGRSIPATGSSIGIDRLLAALLELKAIGLERSTSKVLVTVMDRHRLPDYLKILRELRQAGIPSEIFSGDTKNLTRQIRYGDKVGIPVAVIAGSNEFETGSVTIKNLAAGAEKAADTAGREEWLKAEGFQETIDRSQLIAYVKKLLGMD
jgi:histidyl-tRNA synthetase